MSAVSRPAFVAAYLDISRKLGSMGLTPLITAFRGWIHTLSLWLQGSATDQERGEVMELQEQGDMPWNVGDDLPALADLPVLVAQNVWRMHFS